MIFFKLKSPDKLDPWSFCHFAANVITAELLKISLTVGVCGVLFWYSWEFFEFWLYQYFVKIGIWEKVKKFSIIDPDGISPLDIVFDTLGFIVGFVLINVLSVNWSILLTVYEMLLIGCLFVIVNEQRRGEK